MTEIRYGEWGHFESQKDSPDLYEWQGHRGIVLDEIGEYKVIHCFSCILNHCVPLPSEAWLKQYYQERFFQQKPDYLTRYIEDENWWHLWHGITLTQATELLIPVVGERAAFFVLDVGTGPGLFLDVAKRRGWLGWGLEPAAHEGSVFKEHHRTLGIDTCTCTLREYAEDAHDLGAAHPMAPFDMIHAYEVLEHIPQPDVFLEQCYELLKPGGVIAITVPNDYNSYQMAICQELKLPHWWVSPPEHLNYFSVKSLQLLMRRSGFNIIDARGSYPLERFILMGENYIGNDDLGRQIHHKRVRYEMEIYKSGLFEFLLEEYRNNVEHPYSYAIGREVTFIGQKSQ